MRQNLRAAAAAFGIVGLASAPVAQAEEGMWAFDNFPTERMQSELGWAPDQAWLDRVMGAIARVPGCSASNVSAQGLMLTNHHCVIACVNALSSGDTNFITYGFGARNRDEERACPGTSVQLLQSVTDVTDRIGAAANNVPAGAFAAARDAEIARIEGECTQGATRCEVVALYQGGRYALHRFKRFDDVRLVFAPEHGMAAFGGDADNFSFPRYGLDFAFLRVYENGRPARTPNHLTMSFRPLVEDEIVLIAGNPGRTSRQRSVAELTFERDFSLPWQTASLAELRTRLAAYGAEGADQARTASSVLQNVENAYKALNGRRQALASEAGFARVTANEQDLQRRIQRNRAAQRETGDAWGEITRAQAAYRAMFYPYQYLEARAGERSLLFGWARDIVRGAAERDKPNAERLQRYTDSHLAGVVQGLDANRATQRDLEAVYLAFWLSELREQLGANDPLVRRILGNETPEALAERLSRSRLADRDFRRQLWQGGAAAVAASDDPLIAFVRAWDADARAVRERYVIQVEAPVARAQERIARARFRAFGLEQYPDTTFSPRITYGQVEGWTEPDGRNIAAFTRVGGLFERATGQAPFALSERWAAARPRLDANTIFNVASSNDVIGGNSGSPLLDREGRVVGTVFDGNIHSLGGEYFYDGELNRSVTVASSAIRMALADVYGMRALLSELGGE